MATDTCGGVSREVGTPRALTARVQVCQGSCPRELVTNEGHWRNSDDSVPRDNELLLYFKLSQSGAITSQLHHFLRYLKVLSRVG